MAFVLSILGLAPLNPLYRAARGEHLLGATMHDAASVNFPGAYQVGQVAITFPVPPYSGALCNLRLRCSGLQRVSIRVSSSFFCS